jgi:predicted nucleotidyltransferase
VPLPDFPTPLHRETVAATVEFFAGGEGVEAVLLVNSLARGVATPESDIDVAVLVSRGLPQPERATLEGRWQRAYGEGEVFERFRQLGRFTKVHLDLFDGRIEPQVWDDGGGPDAFELEIGNRVARSLPVWQGSAAFDSLKAEWLPLYGEELQRQRLAMVREACLYDLDFVPFYVARGLYFQAFHRLYKAFEEFLQALFIARRTYPIAYNKWLREQIAGWLGLPDLYAQLPPVLQISRLESDEILHNALYLRRLLSDWT